MAEDNHFTLVEFGASVRLYDNKFRKWEPTVNNPAFYRIKYVKDINRIYSQLEMMVGDMKFQVTLPREELQKALNIVGAIRRTYPVKPRNQRLVFYKENIAMVRERINRKNIEAVDEKLNKEFNGL